MSNKKELNIGMVGYGFMGRTHSNAFLQAPRFFDLPYRPVLKAVCARNADRVKAFAENWGYESIETDWRALVARKDIDLIDIASPNDTHAEIAIAAAKAGKMVMCEKPLGRTADEARAMVDAVESAKVPNMVWYNYRRVPAVMMLKQLSMKVDSAASFTTVRSSCRIGPSRKTCRRAARACGVWTARWPAAASREICWRTTSTWRYGSTARSLRSRP